MFNGPDDQENPGTDCSPPFYLKCLSKRFKMIVLSLLVFTSFILVVLLSVIAWTFVQRGTLFHPNIAHRKSNVLLQSDDFNLTGQDNSQLLPELVDGHPEVQSIENNYPDRVVSSMKDPFDKVYFDKDDAIETSLDEVNGIPSYHENTLNYLMSNSKEEFRAPMNKPTASESEETLEHHLAAVIDETEHEGLKDVENENAVTRENGHNANTESHRILPLSNPHPADFNAKPRIEKSVTHSNLLTASGDHNDLYLNAHPDAAVIPQSSNLASEMTLYRIEKAVKIGAVCLDGSAPAYYHRPGIGNSVKLWIIHFNGGAWCFDAKACHDRSRSSLGSTKTLPPSPPIIQGINSGDPSVNPDFFDWNLVWVVYCDGASFTGDREKPMVVDGQLVYMRGKRILNAIIDDLLHARDFRLAEAVILTGSSAGSMTAMFQADFIAAQFPKTTPVRVLSDAGFFLETSSLGGKKLGTMFKAIYDMQNSSTGLNQDCVKAVGIADGWQCFLPAKAYKYVKTPVFVLNAAYDVWSLIYFMGIDCKFPSASTSNKSKRNVIKKMNDIQGFDTGLSPPESAVFSAHAGSASNTYTNKEYSNRLLSRFEKKMENKSNSGIIIDLSAQSKSRMKRDISGFEIFPFFRPMTDERSLLPSFKEYIYPSNTSVTSSISHSEPYPVKDALEKSSPSIGKRTVRNATNRNTDIKSNQKDDNLTADNTLRTLMNELSGKLDGNNKQSDTKNRNIFSSNYNYNVTTLRQRVSKTLSSKIANDNIKDRTNLTLIRTTLSEEIAKNGTNVRNQNVHNNSRNQSLSRQEIISTTVLPATLSSLILFSTSVSPVSKNSSKATMFEIKPTYKMIEKSKTASRVVISAPNNTHISKHSSDRLKNKRSTSIAREYINILRSDPPECTEKEMLDAMKYRGAIIKATDAFMRLPKSGRFIVSCIDHSLSLFDETWTGLVVSGKSIQQAFGDWFYERGSRPKYNFVDCPYPCNPTCP